MDRCSMMSAMKLMMMCDSGGQRAANSQLSGLLLCQSGSVNSSLFDDDIGWANSKRATLVESCSVNPANMMMSQWPRPVDLISF